VEIDVLIVGAGPVGCVLAERLASQSGLKVLMIDRREHLAGNCFDRQHESGVMIHQYGPHYFRTDSQPLLDYLSQFTSWIPGNYIVKSSINGELYPFPINLDTLEQFFGRPFTSEEAEKFLDEIRQKIETPANSEEFVLSRVGKDLYEAFYKGYTIKQWGKTPAELDASVCGRIPIRFNRDDRYVGHKFQVTPANGFSALFANMIDHANIELRLNTAYADIKNSVVPRLGTFYTGPLDEYFDYVLGELPWRSLRFDFKVSEQEYEQPCVQINYPNENDYTRSVEIKHVTQQKIDRTVVCYEYPQASGEPYYPVPDPNARALAEKYKALAEEESKKNICFVGRLAQYTYINTDEAIQRALDVYQRFAEGALWQNCV
jgi:UDP-galactopyranose mutase